MKKINFKGLFSMGFSDIIGTTATAIFWFFLASIIPPEQYGKIFFYLGIISIVSSAVLFANKNTIVVYVSKNIQLQNTLYVISLSATFVASLVVMIIFVRIDVVFVLVGYVFYSLAIGELLGKKSFSVYSKNVLLQKFLVVILGVSFFYIFGVDGILYAIALSYSSYVILVFKRLNRTPLNFSLLKQHIGFVSNNYSIGLLQITRAQIDKLIIPMILSFSILGHYSLALQIMTAMNLFSNIIFKFILPYDASGEPNTKIKFLTIIISVIISISGIILTPIVLPIAFPAYIDSIVAIQIMSIVVIPTSITFIFTSQFLGMEKSRYVMFSKFLSMIVISVGMIILGSIYGMQGLAIAYLAANSVDAVSLVLLNYYEKNKSKPV
jgi:O-antigen/teichoic acid export membrane protein